MVIDSPGQFKTKRREGGGGDKINTIFTPKQLLGHCSDIVRYLALSPLSESPETLSERLSTFNRYTGVRVRNIEHGFNQGMITIYKRDISGESKQAQHIYEKLGFKYTGEIIEDSLKLMRLKLK